MLRPWQRDGTAQPRSARGHGPGGGKGPQREQLKAKQRWHSPMETSLMLSRSRNSRATETFSSCIWRKVGRWWYLRYMRFWLSTSSSAISRSPSLRSCCRLPMRLLTQRRCSLHQRVKVFCWIRFQGASSARSFSVAGISPSGSAALRPPWPRACVLMALPRSAPAAAAPPPVPPGRAPPAACGQREGERGERGAQRPLRASRCRRPAVRPGPKCVALRRSPLCRRPPGTARAPRRRPAFIRRERHALGCITLRAPPGRAEGLRAARVGRAGPRRGGASAGPYLGVRGERRDDPRGVTRGRGAAPVAPLRGRGRGPHGVKAGPGVRPRVTERMAGGAALVALMEVRGCRTCGAEARPGAASIAVTHGMCATPVAVTHGRVRPHGANGWPGQSPVALLHAWGCSPYGSGTRAAPRSTATGAPVVFGRRPAARCRSRSGPPVR